MPAQKPRPEGIETYLQHSTLPHQLFEPAQKPRPEGIETWRRLSCRTRWRWRRPRSPDQRGLRLATIGRTKQTELSRPRSPDQRGLRLLRYVPPLPDQAGRPESPDQRGLRLETFVCSVYYTDNPERMPRPEGIATRISRWQCSYLPWQRKCPDQRGLCS